MVGAGVGVTRNYDNWKTDDATPAARAWGVWWKGAKIGDVCEVIGRQQGTVSDGDGVERVEVGGGCGGEITDIDDNNDTVTVLGDDGLRYVLDASDVGPVSR